MGLTYFKRYRMELDLEQVQLPMPVPDPNYQLLAWSPRLLRDHARAKFESFRYEMDANIFPCLGRHDGCLRLMRDITSRDNFVPEATWLAMYNPPNGKPEPVGTVQGLSADEWGSIQNLGIAPAHRGRGLGSLLLAHAADGFLRAGLSRMHLEVTTDNTAAVRLYQRLGFQRARTVYKVAEIESA